MANSMQETVSPVLQQSNGPKSNNTTPPITITIAPARGWNALHLREVLDYLDLLYFMVRRDLKTRYSQTALGPLWILINPIFNMVIYTVVFGLIAKLPSGNTPYAVFTFTALLPWDFFTDALGSGTTSLLQERHLISKVYFPRLLLPLSRIISSFVDLGIAMLVLFALMIYFKVTPTWGLVFLPFFLLIAAFSGAGVGFLFSGLIVKYRDFGTITSYMTRVWMYATPVVYSSTLIPPQWLPLYQLNPMTNVIDGFRWALLGDPPPNWPMLMISSSIFFIIFVFGLFVFKRVERNIIDVA